MNRKFVSAMIAIIAIGAGAWSYAAEREAQMGGSMGQQGAREKPGTQGMQGMHEMMGMIRECQGMMGSGGMMPQRPPGNEKLQLQMWGEMMQKMGEIASKYALQVK